MIVSSLLFPTAFTLIPLVLSVWLPLGDVDSISAALCAKFANLSVIGERLKFFTAYDFFAINLLSLSFCTSFRLLPVFSPLSSLSMTFLFALLLVAFSGGSRRVLMNPPLLMMSYHLQKFQAH